MSEHAGVQPITPDSVPALIEDLKSLRESSGLVSYGEIALRVSQYRQDNGATAATAHIARSSVHSMFDTNRRRINADLLYEIVLALGQDEATAAGWRNRCLSIMHNSSAAHTPVSATHPNGLAVGGKTVSATHIPKTTRIPKATPMLTNPRIRITPLWALFCIGLNFFGNAVNTKFELPFFLDMIGTATAAIVLGPWHGALVGLSSNLVLSVGSHPLSFAFALVNITGALVWGYGVRSWQMRSPIWRFALLNVLVAIACTLVAVPINVLIFGGLIDGHASSSVIELLIASGEGIWQSVFSVNLPTSIADKSISGFIGLAIVYVAERKMQAQQR